MRGACSGLRDPDHAPLCSFSAARRISSIARRSSALSPAGRSPIWASSSASRVAVPAGQLGLGEQRAALLERRLDLRRPRALQPEQLAGQDLVDPPVAQDLGIVVDHHVIALAAQQHDVGVRRGLHHQRAVRRHDELRVGAKLREIADDLPLPARVHVQVDLVDQHDRRLRERIGAVRIALEHPAREVDQPSDLALVAEAEPAQRHPSIRRLGLDPRRPARLIGWLNPNVSDLRKIC